MFYTYPHHIMYIFNADLIRLFLSFFHTELHTEALSFHPEEVHLYTLSVPCTHQQEVKDCLCLRRLFFPFVSLRLTCYSFYLSFPRDGVVISNSESNMRCVMFRFVHGRDH